MQSEQTIYTIKVYEDNEYLVARCVELPIVVRGNSDEEILEKMQLAIKEHKKVFPDRQESCKPMKVLTTAV
jgi:hypothetical protein